MDNKNCPGDRDSSPGRDLGNYASRNIRGRSCFYSRLASLNCQELLWQILVAPHHVGRKLELIDFAGLGIRFLASHNRLAPIDKVKDSSLNIPPTGGENLPAFQSQRRNIAGDYNVLVIDCFISAVHDGMIEFKDAEE
jgi:hypothetical protein